MDEKTFKALKEKKDREAKQPWVGIRPPATQCKKCIHAYPNTEYTIGAEKANCNMFQPPDDKTPGILQDKLDCPYFEEA